MSKNLMWFRNDLRVTDNPALDSAVQTGADTTAVFFWCEQQWQSHDLSAARLKLTTHALNGLNDALSQIGISFQVVQLKSFAEIPDVVRGLVEEQNITNVFVNAEYALDERRRDRDVKTMCRDLDVKWHPHHGSIMQIPGTLKTGQEQPYKVFTPFKRAWYKAWPNVARSVKPAPKSDSAVQNPPLALPEIDYEIDAEVFPTSEDAALELLQEFAEHRVTNYQAHRDLPALEGTSRLSGALAIGLISPLQCFNAAVNASNGDLTTCEGAETWVSELIWREFYLNVIYSWPDICKGQAFRPEMDAVAWRYDEIDFNRWCEGKTGFPIVDAAMRQLNETGWMHNRLRMVTAMFLSKYLLIDWRWGERYFMQHLIDGHFAANNGGWQWSASTGTDAAPYFRLLSPIRQGERFDADGQFIRRFVPELKNVDAKSLHKPGSPALLAAGYPEPMIDLKEARDACLTAFRSIRD